MAEKLPKDKCIEKRRGNLSRWLHCRTRVIYPDWDVSRACICSAGATHCQCTSIIEAKVMSSKLPLAGPPSRNTKEESKEYKVFAKGPSRLEAQERKVKFELPNSTSSPQMHNSLLQPPNPTKPTRSPKRSAEPSLTASSPFSIKRSGSPIRRQQIRELEQGIDTKRQKVDDEKDVKTITFEAMVLHRLEELESRIASIEETQDSILKRLTKKD